jgi:hypothetical protein
VKKPIVAVAVLVLLAGCSGGGGGGAYNNPSPSPTSSATSSATPSPGATGTAPTADQVTWAGNVCSDTTALQAEVQGLAAAAAAGGSQAATSISDQMGQISTAVGTLVETVKSAPTGTGDDPGYAEVRSATEAVDQSLKTLQASAGEVEGATGVALVTALATVVADAGTLLTDLSATASAVGTAMKDASSTLGQAFRAAPACATLTTS